MGFASQQTRNPIPRKIIFLFFKLDQEHYSLLKPFLIQFNFLPEKVFNINTDEISLDRNQLFIIYIGYFDDLKSAKSHSEKLKKHLGIDNTIKSI